MAKKVYEGAAMLEAGRFSVLAGELDTATRSATYTRIDALVTENHEYCDEGNYDHLCNLFSAIALVVRAIGTEVLTGFNRWRAASPCLTH